MFRGRLFSAAVIVLVAASLFAACGGGVGTVPPDAGAGDADGTDAGWTPCSSPRGYRVCGVPGCDTPPVKECNCTPVCPGATGRHICISKALIDIELTFPCPDGNAYVNEEGCAAFDSGLATGKPFRCAPYEVGQLMAMIGQADNARYADLGLWTGDPLPTPTVCPTLDKFTVCGGNCGGCPNGQVCTGRSPLHPLGFCVPPSPPTKLCDPMDANNPVGPRICPVGQGCYTFKVQPEAQAEADKRGMCVAIDACQALAANLPGGGTCTPPQ